TLLDGFRAGGPHPGPARRGPGRASSRGIRSAARRAGVSPTTLYAWLKEPEFRAEVERARRAGYPEGLRKIMWAAGRAVRTLVRLLRSGDERVRLKAASAIIRAAFDAEIALGTGG